MLFKAQSQAEFEFDSSKEAALTSSEGSHARSECFLSPYAHAQMRLCRDFGRPRCYTRVSLHPVTFVWALGGVGSGYDIRTAGPYVQFVFFPHSLPFPWQSY